MNANNKETSEICGPIIFDYPHFRAVKDGVCNDFNVSITLVNRPKNEDNNGEHFINGTYEAIVRNYAQTGNGRVMTFHYYAKANEKTEKTNAEIFSSKEALEKAISKIYDDPKGHLNFPRPKHFQTALITAGTVNKINILKNFDETPDDEIFVLCSCRTIGEGVDTKNANCAVICDPSASVVTQYSTHWTYNAPR